MSDLTRLDTSGLAPGAMAWTASVRFTFPSASKTVKLHPSVSTRLNEVLAGRVPVLRFDSGGLGVTFGVAAPNFSDARAEVADILQRIEAELRLKAVKVADFRLTDNIELEAEIRALPEDAVQHVGVVEAAVILGVSKQRVGQLSQKEDFPKPVFRLRSGPVWRESDVRRYAADRRTAPSRAGKKTS